MATKKAAKPRTRKKLGGTKQVVKDLGPDGRKGIKGGRRGGYFEVFSRRPPSD